MRLYEYTPRIITKPLRFLFASLAIRRMHRSHKSAKVGPTPTGSIEVSSQTVLLTLTVKTLIILRSTIKTMTITSKFKKDITTLRSAANGEFFLDVKNPKLYKKVRKFYENDGVTFSGDPLDDYDILIDCIAEDLESVEV